MNTSFATAVDVTLTDTLPEGVTFVSATGGGQLQGAEVVWDLGNLGPAESGDLEIVVELPEYGTYDNAGRLDYFVGLTPFSLDSNVSSTVYADSFPSDTTGAADGSTTAGATGDGDSNSGSEGSGGAGEGSSSLTASGSGGAEGGSASEGDGGCGCTQGGSSSGGWALFGLGMLLARRRRQSLVAIVSATVGCAGSYDPEEDGNSSFGSVGSTGSADTDATGGDAKLDVGDTQADTGGDDTGEEVGCEAIDFLFVIDSSVSMKTHQENLIASFPGFADEIASAVPENDWHVMVVDTDAQWGGADCANACATLGTCPDEPAFECQSPAPSLCDITIGSGVTAPMGEGASNVECLQSDQRYIEAGAAGLSQIFQCMAQVGVDGSSQEHQAESLLRSISDDLQAEDGCNAGFLRDDAILVVTIITDEPDEYSPDDAAAWWNAIVAAKNDDPAAVVVLGLLPDGGMTCEQTDVAPRLEDLVGLAQGGLTASVCEPDYSPFFAQAVDLITETCDEFVPPVPEG